MGGIVVSILLDESSIYIFLDLAFDLVDLVLWGGIRTLCYQTHSKLWYEFAVHLHQLFARHGWGQRSTNHLVFLDELIETGVKVPALRFVKKNPPQRTGCSSLRQAS